LIHAGGFNLGLVMRQLIGVGTARGLQGHLVLVILMLVVLIGTLRRRFSTFSALGTSHRWLAAIGGAPTAPSTLGVNSAVTATCTTGC